MDDAIDPAKEAEFFKKIEEYEAILADYMAAIDDAMIEAGEAETPENIDRRIDALVAEDGRFKEVYSFLGAAYAIKQRMKARAH